MEMAFSLGNLGNLYRDLGYYDEAERALVEAIEVFSAQLGEDHPNVALVRVGLAHALRDAGQDERARALYEETEPAIVSAFGATSAREMQRANGLGYLELDLGRFTQAERLFAQTVETGEALEDPHPGARPRLRRAGDAPVGFVSLVRRPHGRCSGRRS